MLRSNVQTFHQLRFALDLNSANNRLHKNFYPPDPGLLKEHFGIEETVLAGGYGYRQILELVRNGADALLEARGDAIDGYAMSENWSPIVTLP